MNWNHRVSSRSQVADGRSQLSDVSSQLSGLRTSPSGKSLRSPWIVALFLAAIVLCGVAVLRFPTRALASKQEHASTTKPNLSSISLPMFFEPNQGQTDPRVKFLARGSGYGLFLTADEAVLEVQSRSKVETQLAASPSANLPSGVGKLAARNLKPEAPVTSIIRMHLEGANPAPKIAGADLLPGKSNYFIGNDPAKWRRNIPQYARVNLEAVYPGVDLVYYGNQGQLEYDFRVAAGADPGKIALKFDGASPRLEKGELVLATRAGDVRFHAPNVYQQNGGKRRTIEAGFRRLADNVIGFEIGSYDHSRELVIDPTLSYSTYLGTGGESGVRVAVDAAGSNIYLAGTTTSASFPLVNPITPCCDSLHGTQDVFVSKINPLGTGAGQLVFSTYLGGSGSDTATGIAIDSSASIYVAGFTDSGDFPTTPNGFQPGPPAVAGIHGFLTKISLFNQAYNLNYSTYLSGNLGPTPPSGFDQVTGIAVDTSNDAFVTGITTSTDAVGNGFPANANGFQTQSNGAAIQFFASKINTNVSGPSSMVYSTYFGGGFPAAPTVVGGGIAVDTSGNMYFTGGSNFWGIAGPAGQAPFPLLNAQQTCLDQPPPQDQGNCANPAPSALDAFVAKINPKIVGAGSLLFSTFLGGSQDDVGFAIAVDSASDPYITGETFSTDWNTPPSPTPFQTGNGGSGDAFIAKLGPLASGIYPLIYFTYLGGSGEDIGRAIAVDSSFAAHVAGVTNSGNLPVFDPLANQTCQGSANDAFVALIASNISGQPLGDYVTCLGGSGPDEASGVAIDTLNNATYVSGDTQSGNFPVVNPFQGSLSGTQDAFVSKLSALSAFAYTSGFPQVSPSPADVGGQVNFKFQWVNNGPEAANNVIFSGLLAGTTPGDFTYNSTTSSPGGVCPNPVNNVVTCTVGTVAANGQVTVTVVLTPDEHTPPIQSLSVTPSLSANGSAFVNFQCPNPCPIPVPVNDFAFSPVPSPGSQTVTAGSSTSYTVSLSACNSGGNCGPQSNGATYTSSISMSAAITPPTSTITSSFTPTPVTISGSGPTTTTFNVTTQPRPVGSGSLWHRGPIYATWIPVGGLSLLGLGVGASRRRRRWIAGCLLGLIAGIVLLQPACGSSSSAPANTGGTPAGTYTIKITGAAGSDSKNAFVTLVVN